MSLWSVRNGFIGMGKVAALVEADTEADALVKGAAALAHAIEGARYYSDQERANYSRAESAVRVDLPYVGDELP